MAVTNVIEPKSGDELYMSILINRFVDNLLVIPGAILTVITGIVYGAFTNWGFFKHRWIIVKWILSIFVIIIGTFYFNPKTNRCLEIADQMRDGAFNNSELISNTEIGFYGTFGQVAILVFLVIISVFKPWKKKNIKTN